MSNTGENLSASCYHCDLPVPSGTRFEAIVLDAPRAFCCAGCQAVAEVIVAGGLESYYLDRDAPAAGPASLPEGLALEAFDHPDAQREFVGREGELACAELSLDALNCAACAWLIERHLQQESGVARATVNLSNHRLHLVWDASQTPISTLLASLAHIGYRARPFRADTHAAQLKQESRALLLRLAVAGMGMMQVMMYAVAIYVGAASSSGMEVEYRDFLRATMGFIATPVLFYSAYPIYSSAWRALRVRTLTMDVPVTIAIFSAYFASIYASLIGGGETYFDSVSMFVFFLLTSRFLEMKARQRAGDTAASLMSLTPRLATRLNTDGSSEVIAASALVPGDHLQVRPGETIAADGVVRAGQSEVAEALITGEPMPVLKKEGDTVIGGSVNTESPLQVEVTRAGGDSTLATLNRLLNRALSEKPQLAQKADRMAHIFVARVLLLAVIVYIGWWLIDPSHAFWATLAVLVATCPCALSLATPAALTSATNVLAKEGFLLTRGHVLETLAAATHIVFDKTGTLTEGKLVIRETGVLRGSLDHAFCIAASLEQHSEHPVAHAFRQASGERLNVENLQQTSGAGVQGEIGGQHYRLGHAEFALKDSSPTALNKLWLSDDGGAIAWFQLSDSLRPEAATVIRALQAEGLNTWMLSGDRSDTPALMGAQLGMDYVKGSLLPEEKQQAIRQLQAEGAIVVMVGDGVNDAPSLGQAHLSVAMASGTDLAQTTADALLLRDDLRSLVTARHQAVATQRIIRQNLTWALAYNLAILPPAALGFVPPWLAAIGMSLSSLVVVGNALRLRKTKHLITPPLATANLAT
ncbi:MAG TPA: heavy metal translocating P-type ATPase [Moraxellaceae bacterium]|nr:heavy metal translocating P-type ATPase [Moraxellaceae bacterium]HQX89413.1 heavy metal translocating P-type ATPase [Moraxellaceae bacterium]